MTTAKTADRMGVSVEEATKAAKRLVAGIWSEEERSGELTFLRWADGQEVFLFALEIPNVMYGRTVWNPETQKREPDMRKTLTININVSPEKRKAWCSFYDASLSF